MATKKRFVKCPACSMVYPREFIFCPRCEDSYYEAKHNLIDDDHDCHADREDGCSYPELHRPE